MDKILQYKTLQREIFKQFFDTEIIPHLENSDELYYGMGTHGIDKNEEYDYLPSHLSDKVYNFLVENLPFFNKGLCETYMLLEIIDCPTNKDRLETADCPIILIEKYKTMYM